MRRTKKSLLPSVDVMEARLVLSGASPLLSQHALARVVREVRAIVSSLARTENTVEASTQLTALSSQIPSGSEELALAWQSDLALYRPHSAGSIVRTEKRILSDLYNGIEGGNGPAAGSGVTTPAAPGQGTTSAPTTTTGQGSAGTTTPLPTPSLDSVQIENTTGLALVVTVHLDLPLPQQAYITETIPAQGDTTALFDFGTATGDFMTMDVKAADGAQTPPPWSGISLSQPTSGYSGTMFTISLFGPYFNVSV